jgi:exodeoxyribonuclease V beta subunit
MTLDPLAIRLDGRHLIEASAGTGKTYTLAALYLRLVLGHDPGNPERTPLLPPDILVVTYTTAATKELRDRIRARLSEAARCFAGHAEPADPLLRGLLDAYPDGAARARHAEHLRAAADWMDEAAIHTIHGFCHRMLRQHAFDSGNPFELELTDEESAIRQQAIEDYWRQHVYALDAAALAACGVALSPDRPDAAPSLARFADTVSGLLGNGDRLDAPPAESLAALLGAAAGDWSQAIGALRAALAQGLASFDTALTDAHAQRVLARNRKPTPGTWRNTLEPALQQWLASPEQPMPAIRLDDITPACLAAAVMAGRSLPEPLANHPLPAAVEHYLACSAALRERAGPLYAHAARWIDRRIERTKQQRALIGYEDMLTRLRDALEHPEAGARLARVITTQFPVALIDEFQDTDPVQYAIFRSLYVGRDAPPCSLFLIGDPKQAIYGFRGADLDTYLSAAGAVPPTQRHTLGRNFRSSVAMVEAVNSLFGDAANAPDQFLNPQIAFVRMRAQGRDARFEIDGAPAAALTLWHLDRAGAAAGTESLPLRAYREQMAGAAAERISRLLRQAQAGHAGFRRNDSWRAVQPADIAILVRTGREAALIRDALRAHGLRSVYLSDRDNVLATPEARDVLRWLQAMAEPDAERRVRTALGTATLALGWAELDALFGNDARWEAMLERFRDYAQRWQQRGVLPAVRQLLHDQQLAPRLLARVGGERTLSNILQLSELLQDASVGLDGTGALIHWLDQESRRDHGDSPSDEHILRLESDAELIRVVTIHKSKGLEYPLVFLPFVCAYRSASVRTPLLRAADARLTVSFTAGETDKADAEAARLAEDMRLLYVGVTRASHACWLGMAAIRDTARSQAGTVHLVHSAIGRLLGCDAAMAPGDLAPRLAALAERSDAIAVEALVAADATSALDAVAQADPAAQTLAHARRYTASAPGSERWWIASYSALLEDGPRAWAPGSASEDVLSEESRAPAVVRATPAAGTLHAVPAGPATGNLLHGVLQALANEGFPPAGSAAFQRIVTQRLRGQRWSGWLAQTGDWLAHVISTPLPLAAGHSVRLDALARGDYLAEFEFLLSTAEVSAAQIDAVIRRHTLDGVGRPALGERRLNGMLKGFIDLVLVDGGRYVVIDYKSTRLGADEWGYGPQALREEVIRNRYDVQYSLYLLALHRQLRARLGAAYDYDRHVGGAACVFLRGIEHPGRGVHAERPERALVEALDALLRGEVDHAAA